MFIKIPIIFLLFLSVSFSASDSPLCKSIHAIFSSSQLQQLVEQTQPRYDPRLSLHSRQAPEISSVRVLAVCSASVPQCELIAPNQVSTGYKHSGNVCVYTASRGYGEHYGYFRGSSIPSLNRVGLNARNVIVGWIYTWEVGNKGAGFFEYKARSGVKPFFSTSLNIR